MELVSVSTEDVGGWTVLRLQGQLDVATAPRVRQELVAAQFEADRVLVDLDGLELLDSFGLGILVGAAKRARTHGWELAVRCTRPRLLHVLELTGLDEVLAIVAAETELPATE